jgi:WD40 repeat protein
VVGTCSPREKNELTVLTHLEDDNGLESVAFYYHPDEVWAVETPEDNVLGDLVLTSGRSAQSGKTSLKLYRMKGLLEGADGDEGGKDGKQEDAATKIEDSEGYGEDLELACDFDNGDTRFGSFVSAMRWNKEESRVVATKDPHYVRLWQLDASGRNVKETGNLELAGGGSGGGGRGDSSSAAFSGDWTGGGISWATGGANTLALAVQSAIQVVDARSLSTSTLISNAHTGGTTDVDFNPQRPEFMVSSGNDRFAKLWDLRKASEPLVKVLTGHSHWVSTARYNPVHDQLIATGGTDNMVNLWRVASCGKAPWLGSSEGGDGNDCDGNGDDPPDINAKQIDQHEDSVYGVAWSAASPWVCCSLSYDGRVILSHVPSTEKYKIHLIFLYPRSSLPDCEGFPCRGSNSFDGVNLK